MEVNNRLIEKYHLDLCSSEERKAVEEWLLNDKMDDFIFLSSEEKQAEKEQIWQAIAEVLPIQPEVAKEVSIVRYFSPVLVAGIAAATVGVLISVGFLLLNRQTPGNSITATNNDVLKNELIQTSELNITLGPKSNANINTSNFYTNGNINFCGIIRIESKEDMELTLNANCVNTSSNGEKIVFKKGQTYIAVNYHFKKDNELIIVNEKNLFNLPPVLQKEIIRQFNI